MSIPQLDVVEGDVAKAAAYKKELAEILQAACDVITRAKQKDKITLGFALQFDATGRQFISVLSATKEL